MRLALALVAAALIGAAPASAATLPSGPLPLPGSTFQGGDGNQDDLPGTPTSDWEGVQAAGRVSHSPDPNTLDSAFAFGSHEDVPGEWQLTTASGGVNPASDNILDGWSAVDQPDGDTFLHLAFTRERALGTTFLAFELNRDGRLWNNGRDMIPCRRTGDLLVALDAHGNSIELELQKWTTTLADPDSSCALRGRLTAVAAVPADGAQGDVNAGPITSHLPGTAAPLISQGEFAEASLNLSTLMSAVFHEDCFAFGSIWLHSRASDSEESRLKDYVAPQAIDVRNCSASGTKFYDVNANGARDAGEPGIPRFAIWADYDNNGVRNAGEPFAVTDRRGNYVIDDIAPRLGSYRLREKLLRPARATSWVCSYPNAGTPGGFADGRGGLFACGWGAIKPAEVPFAQNRDFGNWLPARLKLEKRLWPGSDPGRFDLKVNGSTIVPAAGDRGTATIALRPGSYDVTETAVPPTDPAAYRSAVSCRRTPVQRGTLRPGTSWTNLRLRPGDQATCTFINVRRPSPAIAIEKTGPLSATAGGTLRYALYVTNPGDVPLAARSVRVRDDTCDAAPKLVSKGGDRSPRTLDPGDTWTYGCTHNTAEPGENCVVRAVTNTATVSSGGLSDDDSITTTLDCPDVPPDPPLPRPEPTPEPTPPPIPPVVVPNPPIPAPEPPSSGGVLPAAGSSGTARLSGPAGCVSRVRRVVLSGRQISRFSVFVDGRRMGGGRLAALQRQARPLHRSLRPGRHRVSVRVRFRTGSATPAVTLTRRITICPAAAPRYTG